MVKEKGREPAGEFRPEGVSGWQGVILLPKELKKDRRSDHYLLVDVYAFRDRQAMIDSAPTFAERDVKLYEKRFYTDPKEAVVNNLSTLPLDLIYTVGSGVVYGWRVREVDGGWELYDPEDALLDDLAFMVEELGWGALKP